MEMKQQNPGQGGYAQPAQTTVIIQNQVKPNSYLVLSCITYWCCNCIFGGIAFGLSMASKSAADENDLETARSRGRAAMWCSVAGIITTILIVVILVIVYFTIGFAIMGNLQQILQDAKLQDNEENENEYGGN